MKQLTLLFLLLSVIVTSSAQIQNGLVKTNGRPHKPGTPLANVAIKTSGHTASLSSTNGKFSIAMNGLKGGDPFFLTSVIRRGYELADRNAIGRKYSFSTTVPMMLTMVSKTELEEEKQRIRNNAIEATQKKYNQLIEELERKLQEKSITIDDYGKQLQKLQKKIDMYNELVENLADKYARTDYDIIDALDQEINNAIEEGMFDKADSLIRSKGDIDKRHQRMMEWNASSKKQKETIDRQMKQWETSESSRLKDLENLADDYYHSFTIEVSRMHPEEAVKWLEKRAKLDPERFEWLIEIGRYYKIYLAKYERAMDFFERAYKIAQKTELSSQYITVLNEQGGVYAKLHEIKKAKKMYQEAIRYANKDHDRYFQAIASIYNNLGILESENSNYEKALEFYNQSLSVAPDTLLESAVNTYANISTIYHHMNQFDLADRYLNKAIENANQKNNKLTLSVCFNNKGALCNDHGKDKEAITYYEKALEIEKEIFPSTHPSIALTLSNISTTFYHMSLMKESLKYTTQALSIFQGAYGEIHPQVALCYDDIVNFLLDAGLYEKALTFAKKSWEINKVFYSKSSKEYASYCNKLGRIYDGLQQDSLSMIYYYEAKNTYEHIGMDKTSAYASVCNNLSTALTQKKEYGDALEYARKNLELISLIKGKENSSYITGLNNLASVYENSNRIDSALTIYLEAEGVIIKTYGKWHKTLCVNYNNVGNIYLNIKEYNRAREYLLKSLEICDSIYKQPNELSMIVLSNIAMTYYNDSKWSETLPWIEKAAAIRLRLVKDENRRYSYHTYIYNCYSQMAKNGDEDDVRNFIECQDSIWVRVNIMPDGIAAKKHNLSGNYILLRYGNWQQGGRMNFIDESRRMQNVAPKSIVLYKDKIEQIKFEENKMGVSFYFTLIDKQEAQSIKEKFAKWKKDHAEE